ncbi:hypothetical protein HRR83_003753 [Exophiala dermatitidis]|uniref:Uncharacterized protein n=2 Tax=Exophiala dermatitidis TaxID=5970 RepID=H6BP92_EXODN|nr:uncharacterized protein HMPREF1120_01736 [Exophiala dermatitidis NIH/UT8656]KAJ4518945.1 hypothetical protein HRR75_002621 [Exophiala dermatitidis]EHY53547.1 hypothetical protein HMPREF1120_01736 [Exophiala dermatitidis NIH/UT8656]KAJ4522282.1 hypothetical protein HRR74_002865 [Exophiala dermatitidis]KAJ4529607.1 hypothetical protein HRR73_000633 [Exophiala dermatitidis]KAJ4543230.1 hypothetical protein HRR77_005486 [Exophiala dermatitidis]
MKLSLKLLVVALASTEAVASTWFGKAAYNKWHETELERWLSDHDVPYPSPADRKDLENLVKENWQAKVVQPVSTAGDKTADHYGSVKDWIFDSWSESSLKAFLDYHKIPAPQPRTRDSLLTTARQNYDTLAKKLGEYASYPGDWLYSTWSESDLKEWLDERGIPAPQPTTRDKLIAQVRRHARQASLNASNAASAASASYSSGISQASKSAASAQASLSDALFDAWSDSQLKEFLDSHGVPVPQGSKKNELIALARKHRKQAEKSASSISGHVSGSAASAYGAATSSAGNEFAKATDDAALKAEDAFNKAIESWSESRLKAYLDARGVPVPQGSKRDELLAQVRLNKHKAATGWSAWTFDTWTLDNLKNYLRAHGKKVSKKAEQNRQELLKQVQDSYASASKSGGTGYASVTSYLAKQTGAAKDTAFDTWSDSDLKDYLDSYGIPNYQGSTTNELRAEAKKQANYFRYGTSSPSETIVERIKNGLQWFLGQIQGSASSASATVSASGSSVASDASKTASKSASSASSAASKSASSASSAASSAASKSASSASKSASSAKNEL